jgi:excisionase family DNA binding protein
VATDKEMPLMRAVREAVATELDKRLLDPAARKDEDTFITVDEAAELMRLDRKTVYQCVKDGELPGARRVKGAVRIHRATLIEWFRGPAARRSRRR